MKHDELPFWSDKVAQWTANYHAKLNQRPVRPNVKPGDTMKQIAKQPPQDAESMEQIFADFERIIPDGMTHWQHPGFLAYFNSNAAPASMLAEQLANAFSAQCMLWQTSPAATELETVMVDWLRQALGLPGDLIGQSRQETHGELGFRGVIQDSATSATLSAVLTMREHALGWRGNEEGLAGGSVLRIYASDQAHSSIDKAVRLAGIGQNNLVKVPTDEAWAMCPVQLQAIINADRVAGYLPAGIVGCIGGTSIGASDPLEEILTIAENENLYSHVDAAWAGSAMICPEFRNTWRGIELADSIVFNPHKWLGANFDCSVQFLKQPRHQIKTLSIKPAYLETLEQDAITNYSEWCIPLGRRFRALKLWFLMRAYGMEGLQERIRNHIRWANEAAAAVRTLPDFEIVTPPMFSLFTFRFTPHGQDPDEATQTLLESINQDGRIYLTQTKHEGKFVIRFVVGQFDAVQQDILNAVRVIEELGSKLTS